jgi:hypothetical protein
MIDATVIRAHHCAADGKGGSPAMRLAVCAAASRLRSTRAPTPMGARLRCLRFSSSAVGAVALTAPRSAFRTAAHQLSEIADRDAL